MLRLADTWVPDERTELVAFGMARSAPTRATRASRARSSHTRLVSAGSGPPPRRSRSIRPSARVEAVEWWRRPPRRRDHVAAWTGGAGEGALAWVELPSHLDESGEATLLGWID